MRRSLLTVILLGAIALLGGGPAAAGFSLGIGILDTDRGIEVQRLSEAGSAYQAGVRVGDVIVKADLWATPSSAHLIAAVRRAGADGAKSIALTLERDGAERVVETPIGLRDDAVGLREQLTWDDGPLAMLLAMNGLSKSRALCAQDRVAGAYSAADMNKAQAVLYNGFLRGEGRDRVAGAQAAETLTTLIGEILRAGHCSVTASELRGELYPVKARFKTRLGLKVHSDGGELVRASGNGLNLALANIGAFGRSIDIGALVVEALPDGPAAEAGLEPGMMILSINGVRVNGQNIVEATQSFPPGHAVELRVVPRDAQAVLIFAVTPTD